MSGWTDPHEPGARPLAPADRLEAALRGAIDDTGHPAPALVAFLTGGHPTREGFSALLRDVAEEADAVEVGVPFSDPMADGVTIQESSRKALEQGVNLSWILDTLRDTVRRPDWPGTPLLLMGYLNPFLRMGMGRLADRARDAGVCGFIIPDLPLEESAPIRATLASRGLALVGMVTPVTPPARRERICREGTGFIYAVTRTGITGGDFTGGTSGLAAETAGFLDAARAVSRAPLLAGFGIRSAEQVRALAAHCDGVIVGSALIEVIDRGEDPGAFLRGLRR
ncbi:MAG: tryptophan synthase subunit alpha [Deltaproteobacteria bacterium]|nr:MAG: tryptophan synthase subunit alpha [Deltaproteobacteria bacterium]